MPRPLGVLLIAAAALLLGVYGWFGLVWLLVNAAKLTHARALDIAMYVVAPHMLGLLVAFVFALVAFVVGLRFARKRRIAWLGFAAAPASSGIPSPEASPPPR